MSYQARPRLAAKMIINNVTKDKIKSVDDVIVAHNLFAIARQTRIIGEDDQQSVLAWHIQEHVYRPARKLHAADPALLKAIFCDGELKLIVKSAYQFAISHSVRSDMKDALQQINQAFGGISERFNRLEARTTRSTRKTFTEKLLAKLNNLRQVLKGKSATEVTIALASCCIAMLSTYGSTISKVRHDGSKGMIKLVKLVNMDDKLPIVQIAFECMASDRYVTDLSDIHMGFLLFTEDGALGELDEEARVEMREAVRQSHFGFLTELQSQFLNQNRNSADTCSTSSNK